MLLFGRLKKKTKTIFFVKTANLLKFHSSSLLKNMSNSVKKITITACSTWFFTGNFILLVLFLRDKKLSDS